MGKEQGGIICRLFFFENFYIQQNILIGYKKYQKNESVFVFV
jgi:hypothetical protein